MKALLLAAMLFFQTPQSGFFSADPSWLPATPTHEHTQVGHGLIVGAAALGGALLDGERGAKFGAAGMTIYYGVREIGAQRAYREMDLTRQEYRKASWDSYMDVAWPLAVAAIPMTWKHRRKVWPLWVVGLVSTFVIGRATDPGGMYSGMY